MVNRRLEAGRWGISVTIGCWMMLVAVSVTSAKGPGRGQIAGNQIQNPTLTVRVYTRVPILPKDLAAAERVASRIFEQAGMELIWLNCPTDDPMKASLACSVPETPMEVHLGITADYPKAMNMDTFAMGFALTTPIPGRGQIANVAYERAKRQRGDAEELSLGELLGLGIAHELGHLLLGSDSHSRVGIMRPQWKSADLKLENLLQSWFTGEQAARIRLDMRARMEAQAALQNPQLSSK